MIRQHAGREPRRDWSYHDQYPNVGSDFKVATDKFQVTATSGNTAVGGTLGVTGGDAYMQLLMSTNIPVATSVYC